VSHPQRTESRNAARSGDGGTPSYTRSVDERGAAHARRLAWSTAIFSLATGLSRIAGLVREIFAAYYFGIGGRVNAFTVAFQVPNLVRSLVADQALSSAFVPVFSSLLTKGERKRAWRVASTLFWLMLLGLGALTALLIVFAPLIIRPFGDPGGDQQLAVGLSRVLFPIVTLLGISGVIVGILNSYEQFTVPAITPIFWNLAIIVGLVIGVPRAHTINAQLYVYAISIVVGTVIQVLLPVPWLLRLDGRLQFLIDWRDPAVRRVFVLMVPVTIGLGLINFNLVVDSIFASRLIDPELAPSALDKAFRLYMLPQGMFSVAVATVLFPSLSRFAARGDMDGFRDRVSLGLRQIAFLLLPASVVSLVLAEPIVRLVYQRGQFGPAQTPVVAAVLAAFSAGLTFNGAMLMLNRGFFSLQLPWIPTLVALGNLGLNAVLDALFYSFGTWGIALSTTIVNIAGTAALLVLLHRRLGRLDLTRTAGAVTRILLACVPLAVVSYGLWRLLHDELGHAVGVQILSLGVALVAGAVVYLAACRVLGVRELQALRLLRRSNTASG
jgi:putative peptidoglycan lipid II flippase